MKMLCMRIVAQLYRSYDLTRTTIVHDILQSLVVLIMAFHISQKINMLSFYN